MRLLNVHTLELKEFLSHDSELYAILSHTWDDGEVTFKDFSASSITFPAGFNENEPWVSNFMPAVSAPASSRKGFRKLMGWCEKVRSEGFDWAWIDTCCIDKSSSAELSEAINSMYAWYGKATVCYAYLADVRSEEEPSSSASSFRRSRWFTRGWTLQEMLAPTEVIFLGADWAEIGTRSKLAEVISQVTGIEEGILMDPSCRGKYSLAQRMSWAATRRTTRIEDEAYSLLGFFYINMPLLYGEGRNAFLRLQVELLNRYSSDPSILAWEVLDDQDGYKYDPEASRIGDTGEWRYTGVLAESVAAFRNSGRIIKLVPTEFRDLSHPDSVSHSKVWAMATTKQLLELKAPVYEPLYPHAICGPSSDTEQQVIPPPDLRLQLEEKRLSRLAYENIINHSHRLMDSEPPVGNPLKDYIDNTSIWFKTFWDRHQLVIVGEIESTVPSMSNPLQDYSMSYIAIMLDSGNRTSTQGSIRIHWPSLLLLDFNAKQGRFWDVTCTWPLTVLQAETKFKFSREQSRKGDSILLTGPAEYGLRDNSKPGDVVHFIYQPSIRPFRFMNRLPEALEYTGGPPTLPTFTLYFRPIIPEYSPRETDKRSMTVYISGNTFRSDTWDSMTDDKEWTQLKYQKTWLPLSKEKAITILRRKGPSQDIYNIKIEDVLSPLSLSDP